MLQKECVSDKGLKYLLALPSPDNASVKLPALIFLHGIGERGNDLELVKRYGLPKFVKEGKSFPFLVISPQCPRDKRWEDEDVAEAVIGLLEEVVRSYPVDTSRIYLTGYSMGGQGVWELAIRYPGYFAALLPVSGRRWRNFPQSVENLRNTPIWIFHSIDDGIIPASEVWEIEKVIGGNVHVTYLLGGHYICDEAYAEPELYKWLGEQKKGNE
ncbi:MAG: PHB depolymerase family esterase [Candidatus Pacebacteria bacterium]|nr:PHB depolymerase family esterase [Candidatus Paceibacterota bacterium]